MKSKPYKWIATLVLLVLAAGVRADTVRHLRWGYTVTSRNPAVVPSAELLVRLPLAATPWQRCTNFTATCPFEIIREEGDGQVMRVAFTNLPPFAARTLWVDVDVVLSDIAAASGFSTGGSESEKDGVSVGGGKVNLENRKAGRGEEGMHAGGSGVPDFLISRLDGLPIDVAHRRWLGPDGIFDYRDSAFERETALLRAGPVEELPHSLTAAVADRVQAIAYSGENRGALYAWNEKRGDCSEQMALFVALCRRAGIPALGVGGIVTSRDRVVRGADYHNWAVFHAAGSWGVADPSARVCDSNGLDYVAFEWIDGAPTPQGYVRRYRLVGEGLTVTME